MPARNHRRGRPGSDGGVLSPHVARRAVARRAVLGLLGEELGGRYASDGLASLVVLPLPETVPELRRYIAAHERIVAAVCDENFRAGTAAMNAVADLVAVTELAQAIFARYSAIDAAKARLAALLDAETAAFAEQAERIHHRRKG